MEAGEENIRQVTVKKTADATDIFVDGSFVQVPTAFTERTQLANRQIAVRGAKGSAGVPL